MPRFILKSGSHVQDGQTFREGDAVDSDHDLIALFPNKFDLEGARRPRRAAGDPAGQPPGDTTQLVGTSVKDPNVTAADPDAPGGGEGEEADDWSPRSKGAKPRSTQPATAKAKGK